MKKILRIVLVSLAGVLVIITILDSTDDQQRKFEQPIDESELIFKKGAALLLDFETSEKAIAIITQLSKQEGVIWYGLSFTNYNDSTHSDLSNIEDLKLFGRKIQSSLHSQGYFEAIDVDYVREDCIRENLNSISLIKSLNLKNDIPHGAEGASSEFSAIYNSWQFGQEIRLTPPDDYRDHLTKTNDFNPDEYLPLSRYLK